MAVHQTGRARHVMELLHRIVVVCLTICLNLSVSAQDGWEREVQPFTVTDGVTPIEFPFLGGIVDPKPQFVDLDGDNLSDLFIGNEDGRIMWFRNVGSAAAPAWEFQSQRFAGIDIGTWFRFDDIDADGDPDLFTDNRLGGVKYYRNESVGLTPDFVMVDSVFGGFVTGSNNTCDFADLDDDNDLDFFYGNTTGRLEFYENVGTPTTPSFVFGTAAYDSILAFPGAGPTSDPAHGFSSISFVDINADNAIDLFWGDLFNTNIYLFDNLGTPSVSDLTWNTDSYLATSTLGFNHVALADMDNDSDLDMLLGVANGSPFDNLRYLRNDGLPQAAAFNLVDLNYIKCIDYGNFTRPALADLDNDGDIDMLVGKPSGELAYFENVGGPYTPSFVLVSAAWNGIDVGSDASPELFDIDNDGDLDLLIGTGLGRIQYWSNEGSPSSFLPILMNSQWLGIKVDQLAVPRIADMNNDSLPDMVLGEWDFNGFANVLLYQNIGTIGSPNLVLLTNALLKRESREFTLVQVYDWDIDGRTDLLVGGAGESLLWYRNEATIGTYPDSNSMIVQADTLPGYDNGSQLSLVFADIDGDGDDDVFVGEDHGGVNFHRKLGSCCIGVRGDINDDGSDADPVDLSYLVDFLFSGGPGPICPLEADINADDAIGDPVDLSYLVDFLFSGGAAPAACP